MIRAMLVSFDERLPVEFDIQPVLLALGGTQRLHLINNLVRGNLTGYAGETVAELACRDGSQPELAERMAELEFYHGEPNAAVVVRAADLARWIAAADASAQRTFGEELARRAKEQEAVAAAMARWFTAR